MTVADVADAAEVTRHRRHHAGGRADHGLGDEADDAFRADRQNFRLQFIGRAHAVVGLRFAGRALAVRIARRDVFDAHQERLIRRAPLRVAADRQRAQGVAVVTLAARDEQVALWFAGLDKILAREFERGFHRLRAAADQVGVAQVIRRMRDEMLGQLLERGGGEKRGVRITQLCQLRAQGLGHGRVVVPQTRHRRAAATVQILFSGGVN